MSKACDVVVVSTGQSGLVGASYLAQFGLKKLALERGNVIGGAASTQQIARKFRASVFSHLTSTLRPRIMADIDLRRRRSRPIMPPSFGPTPRDDCNQTASLDRVGKTAKRFGRCDKEDGEIYLPGEWPDCCIIEDGGLLCGRRSPVGTPGSICGGSSAGLGFGSSRAAAKKYSKFGHD